MANEIRAKLAPQICVLIMLVLNLAFYAKAAPTLRLVELTVCREYYQEHDDSKIGPGGSVDENDCKVGVIQKVVWLFMADELLHFCCGQLICARDMWPTLIWGEFRLCRDHTVGYLGRSLWT